MRKDRLWTKAKLNGARFSFSRQATGKGQLRVINRPATAGTQFKIRMAIGSPTCCAPLSDGDSNRFEGRSSRHLKRRPFRTVPNGRSTKLWRKIASPSLDLRNRCISSTAPPWRGAPFIGFYEALAIAEHQRERTVAEGEELGSNLLRVDQRSCKQWSERTRGTSPDVGSGPMRAPTDRLPFSFGVAVSDRRQLASAPSWQRHLRHDQPSRHCGIVPYVLRQTARTLDRDLDCDIAAGVTG